MPESPPERSNKQINALVESIVNPVPTKAWNPMRDWNHAMEAHNLYCQQLVFSKRQRYLDRLHDTCRLPSGSLAAWPDALCFLTPAKICNAIIEHHGQA